MKLLKAGVPIIFLLFSLAGFAQLNADFTVDTNYVCVGIPVQFTDISEADTIVVWEWDFGDAGASALQHPAHIYGHPGRYTVWLTIWDQDGSYDESIKGHYITVRDTPTAQMTINTDIFDGSYSVLFGGVNPDEYNSSFYWNFGDNQYDTIPEILHTYSTAGNYNIRLIVNCGKMCRDTTDTTLTIQDAFIFPNIFSPNSDGINDLFFIETNGYTVYTMTIFNRWGQVVYTNTASAIIWDGRNTAGIEAGAGNYFYIIESVSGESRYRKSGCINLVR
ncbi:MAG: gliding motility-associated C-terminal domain-containing protein [Bacteroidetes bacterium]|nr:gliding motility-associated C-terminal domain-containing protein [Bacteroidota bacterium]